MYYGWVLDFFGVKNLVIVMSDSGKDDMVWENMVKISESEKMGDGRQGSLRSTT